MATNYVTFTATDGVQATTSAGQLLVSSKSSEIVEDDDPVIGVNTATGKLESKPVTNFSNEVVFYGDSLDDALEKNPVIWVQKNAYFQAVSLSHFNENTLYQIVMDDTGFDLYLTITNDTDDTYVIQWGNGASTGYKYINAGATVKLKTANRAEVNLYTVRWKSGSSNYLTIMVPTMEEFT